MSASPYHDVPVLELLVNIWQSVPREHRHLFITEMLAEPAADALLTALTLRQPEPPAEPPTDEELRAVWARESAENVAAHRKRAGAQMRKRAEQAAA